MFLDGEGGTVSVNFSCTLPAPGHTMSTGNGADWCSGSRDIFSSGPRLGTRTTFLTASGYGLGLVERLYRLPGNIHSTSRLWGSRFSATFTELDPNLGEVTARANRGVVRQMPDSSRHVLKLLILGIVFHIVFIASVFDCYFRSPVVHGMTRYGSSTGESKRLVLIVGMSDYTMCAASS